MTAIGAAIFVVGAVGLGTGMSYAGQNGAAAPAKVDAAPAVACSLVVPPDPLSAKGLATPYELAATGNQGACHEADSGQAAFVQATVVDPATGKVSVYNPLVIDKGTRPAVAPVTPVLPKQAVVGIWFGFNGDNLTLVDSRGSLNAGSCVNGVNGSIFAQFAYCNAPAFFTAANAAIKAGKLKVPPLGTGKDGNPCPTTRDFTVVDQDQSDNVTSAYLVRGRAVAQDTAANRAKLPNATIQVNGSDNLLLVHFVDQAVGCTPFQAPDLADKGALTTSLGLDELQAAAGQGDPVALVPPNDPMAEVGGRFSTSKLNLYRQGVDMPAVGGTGGLAAPYCQKLVDLAPQRLQQDRNLTRQVASPDPATANSLFTFLAQRLGASYGNLGCDKLIKNANPVKVKIRNGVAVDASFLGQPTAPTSAPTSAAPTSAAPTSAAPTSAAPTSGRPTSAAPTSAAPTSAAPTSAAPTSARPTTTRPTSAAPSRGRSAPATARTTAPATPAPTGATVKDDFTPTAAPPVNSGRTTTAPPASRQTTTTHSTATAARTSGSGKTVTTVEPATDVPPTPGTSAAAAGYQFSNDGGGASAAKQNTLTAQDVPVAKKSGLLALTGGNTFVLIGGAVVLILIGMGIMAVLPSRRFRRTH